MASPSGSSLRWICRWTYREDGSVNWDRDWRIWSLVSFLHLIHTTTRLDILWEMKVPKNGFFLKIYPNQLFCIYYFYFFGRNMEYQIVVFYGINAYKIVYITSFTPHNDNSTTIKVSNEILHINHVGLVQVPTLRLCHACCPDGLARYCWTL